MFTLSASLLLVVIFTTIAVFHFYWFLGGMWGLKNVIPTKSNQLTSLKIPKFATLLVAIVFLGFAAVYLEKSQIVTLNSFNSITNYTGWFIAIIFIFRAIGDFKCLGFFKKINHSDFAKSDTKLFSPLCLTIGILAILIQLA
jgi:small-conductance mechanosensitive channel